MIDPLARNLRYAIRSLLRTPGFTATAVLTLALGIGANIAVFSALDAVLLKPLPYPAPDRLVRVRQTAESTGNTDVVRVRRATVLPGFTEVWGIPRRSVDRSPTPITGQAVQPPWC